MNSQRMEKEHAEILDPNPFRRTSEEIFWGRLSVPSSEEFDTNCTSVGERQPSESDKNIEERLEFLSRMHEARKSGRRIDPFMGAEVCPDAPATASTAYWDPLLWSRDKEKTTETTVTAREEETSVEMEDLEFTFVDSQEYSAPVSYEGSESPEWSIDDMEWLPASQEANHYFTTSRPTIDFFEHLVNWEEDCVPHAEHVEGQMTSLRPE